MICQVPKPVFTKSSVFSLVSTATATTVNNSMQKIKEVSSFFNMYQSISFMSGYPADGADVYIFFKGSEDKEAQTAQMR